MKFKFADYFFIALLVCVFVGFWPSYFSHIFKGTAAFTHYFHFHAVTALLWIAMLIAQPLLIRRKMFVWHRRVGTASYLLVPVLFISILLLAHHRLAGVDGQAREFWITFKDLIIFSFGFGVAIAYRKTMSIHARGMIVAGMALIEPTMVRVAFNVIAIAPPAGYLLAISIVYVTLALLIFRERREVRQVRWIFPVALGLFLFVHTILITNLMTPPWEAFTRWFVSLPLT